MKRSFVLTRMVLFAVILTALTTTALQAQTAKPREEREERERPDLREKYFFQVRSYPFDKIPQRAWLNAIAQSEATLKPFRSMGKSGSTTQSVNQWRCIGPFNIGGRINSIAVHPTDGKTLYVGAADGGVWKSTNNGTSWAPMMDQTNAIAMGAVCVDPQNPNTVYAGTGENHGSIDAYTGAGMMKSTDAGATWRVLSLTNVGSFSRIIVHPTNSNIIFAAAAKNNGGVYRSEDAGVTWTRTLDKATSEITVDPQNPNNVLAGTFGNGVYRSTDGAKTFTVVTTGLPTSGTTWTMGRTSIRYAPSNPSIVYLLVHETLTSSSATTASRIYKSGNGGVSWSVVFDNQTNFMNTNGSSPQGWYNNCLAVKPDNPNIVIAGGQTAMAYTTNGGQSWSILGSLTHPDHHALEFDPSNPNRIYNGNDGGMYMSTSAGSSWGDISNGLAITQFYAMGIDQRASSTTYGGTQDNGTMNNGGNTIAGSDGGFTIVDHSNSNIIYGETPGGALWKINGGSQNSINNGFDPNDDPNWMSPIVMDPQNASVLYNGRKKIYRTDDGGGNWYALSPSFGGGDVAAIGVSPVNTDVIYGGSDRGVVMVSTNGGLNWTRVSSASGLVNRSVMDFAPSLTDAGTAYIALGGFGSSHVFKTTNYGTTWTDISNGLPDIPATALAIHPTDPKIIYLGTDIGMFITTDDGATWATYNYGMPRVVIADLEVHKTNKTLRAATHGRSMWEIDLEKPSVPPSITSPIGGEIWTGVSQHVVSWHGFTGPVKLEYSLDDGATWKEIATNVAGNTLRWNVPDTTTMFARIRASNVSEETETATSNSFTITRFSVGGILANTSVGGIPYGICYDGQYLWSTDFSSNVFTKLDPDNLATVATVTTNLQGGDSLFTDITYHPEKGHFFVHKLFSTTASGKGYLYEMDKNGNQVGSWRSPCDYPIGLAWVYNEELPYLLVTDRNGSGTANQAIYLIDPDAPGTPTVTLQRATKVENGPRGAASPRDGKTFYQLVTDFTGGSLQSCYVARMTIDQSQTISCTVPLTSPSTGGSLNARGVEFDPRDSNLWVSDYNGNIYKVAVCGYKPKPQGGSGVTVTPDAFPGVTLSQNNPNPFATTTEIAFTLPKSYDVSLVIYDMQGKAVAQPATGRYDAGSHRVRFDSKGIASGTYRYVLQLNGVGAVSRTMVIVR